MFGGQVRHVVRGDDLGARTHNKIAKAFRERNLRGTYFVAAARPPGRATPECWSVDVGEINRAALGAEQRDDLAQGEIQDFVEIERLRRHHGHGVERVEFAVAAAHLVFGAALLGRVENKSLIALDVAAGIACGKAAFDCQQDRAVFAAQRYFKVADVVVSFDLAAEGVALLGIDADFRVQVQHQQFFRLAVAEHVHERVVAVEELARWVGDVNAFLHLLEEKPVFFFGGSPIGDVADNVNRPSLRAALLGVGRGRNHREAAEARVSAFGEFFIRTHRAVGTPFPFSEGMRQGTLRRSCR